MKLPFRLTVLEDINVLDAGMHHIKVLKVENVTDEVSSILRISKAGEGR